METLEVRDTVSNAIRYWERGRMLYNLILMLVVVLVFLVQWPLSGQRLSLDLLLQFFLLAVLANVAYCAAYPADLMAQFSSLRATWLRLRWVLFLIGTLFACTLAQFIARGALGGHA